MKSKINIFLILSIILHQVSFFRFNFSDILLIIFLLYSVVKYKFIFKGTDLFILLIWISGMVPFFRNLDESYFKISDFILTYAKFTVYLLTILILPKYLEKDMEKTTNSIKFSILIIAFLGITQFILYNIPITRNIIIDNFEGSISYGMFRVTSIFSEPASFSLVSLLYVYLVYSKVKLSWKFHFILLLTIGLTVSFTAISILALGLIIIYLKNIKKFIPLSLVVLVVFILLYNYVPLINTHTNNLITLNNSSAVTRVYGGLEYAIRSPFGVGMGQIENYYEVYKESLNLKYISTESGTVTNVFAAMILTLGIIGTLLFITYLSIITKDNIRIIIIFFIYFFSTGQFNTSIFFIVASILIATHTFNLEKQENEIINIVELKNKNTTFKGV